MPRSLVVYWGRCIDRALPLRQCSSRAARSHSHAFQLRVLLRSSPVVAKTGFRRAAENVALLFLLMSIPHLGQFSVQLAVFVHKDVVENVFWEEGRTSLKAQRFVEFGRRRPAPQVRHNFFSALHPNLARTFRQLTVSGDITDLFRSQNPAAGIQLFHDALIVRLQQFQEMSSCLFTRWEKVEDLGHVCTLRRSS